VSISGGVRNRPLHLPPIVERLGLAVALVCAALLGIVADSSAIPAPTTTASPPGPTRIVYAPGKIVPIPASISHEASDMVDKRILPDLRWIAQRYPIFVTDGYSGPLPDGEHAGCDECHTKGSDHYNGLAVDLVPLGATAKCDAAWAPITSLALWAEPVQNEPALPFRWVGYDGDAGHGCGNHLHLSWNHATVAEYRLAEWVEVLPTGHLDVTTPPATTQPPPPAPPRKGPTGGISQVETGGVSPRRD
jgi:hypothetical protein